jgi:hypothetical protein
MQFRNVSAHMTVISNYLQYNGKDEGEINTYFYDYGQN